MGPQVQTFSALPVECPFFPPFFFLLLPGLQSNLLFFLLFFFCTVHFMLMSAIIKTCSKGNNKKNEFKLETAFGGALEMARGVRRECRM